MKQWTNNYGTVMRSGLLSPVFGVVLGDVCPEQARGRVLGLAATTRHDDIPTGAFRAVTGSRPCSLLIT